MKAGADHVADPITTTKMLAGLRRAEFPYPLTLQTPPEEQELELSLGLPIGGAAASNKRKSGGGDFLSGSFPAVDPNRKCRARLGGLDDGGGGIRDPTPMCAAPEASGFGFPCMVPCCAPPVRSDPGWGCRQSSPKFGNPSLNPNLTYCLSGSPATSSSAPLVRGGSSSTSSDTRSNSLNPDAGDDRRPKLEPAIIQESISKPAAGSSEPTNNNDKVDQMPCVMAKGPNGRITSGFLYRYNETEISIVCVCHGSSFSPAGFVRHAGGNESSHPLRQIMVVPS